ncbi:FadR/GntR family transcriptional regulator [Streptomyces hirsutus]|uniref:FadR/GntR family transcriptional regulator n=1 Tax=Streptomyces hirsutus TaxID=35620 RepID=UPI0036B25E55
MNLSDSQTGGVGPRRVSAMEAVLSHLRDAIERGEYAIGDKLPSEAELCRTLEVSRPVLREALRALQTMGLTASRTGKGTFVVADAVGDPTFGDYTAGDLLEVRRHVEIPVARYAARRRTPEHLELLRQLLDRMDRETDTTAWAAMDTHFHLAVAEATRNPVFRRVIEEIRDALARQSAFLNQLGDRREQSNREHRAVVEALADGSEDAAAEAMAHHLERVGATLTAIVRPAPAAPRTAARAAPPPRTPATPRTAARAAPPPRTPTAPHGPVCTEDRSR